MNFEVLETGEVLKVEEMVTTKQTATVKTYYDQEFHTKLLVDKTTITADGTDTATVTAEIYNYLDEPQAQNIDVTFELDGEQQTVAALDGVASITFNTQVPGEYIFKTVIPNYRNGEIKVVAE